MKELNDIEKLIHILSSEKSLTDRYSRDIKWFQDRQTIWKHSYIRVGVIGVTSSGKSTLINALLGEILLPTAVRPSSGRLVTCIKDKSRRANIYFENASEPKSLEGNKLTLNEIANYADEVKNPNNVKKVRHIELASPKYALGENIMLIDSPGLDAYGLDNHEKLTLEILLPTIDFCIFVTTLKANSDSTTLRVLNAIEEHKKPIIILQNMLDSVEPKIGLNGVVLKTREEVAADHVERVRKIVEKSNIKDKSIVDIVQISSKLGLNGRLNDKKELVKVSRLDQLTQTIERRIQEKLPQIEAQRALQLKKYLEELIENEKSYCTKSESNTISLRIYGDSKGPSELQKNYNQQKIELEQTLAMINPLVVSTNKNIDKLDEDEISTCERIVSDFKHDIAQKEGTLLDKIKRINLEFAKVFKELNLVISDYNNEKLALTSVSNLSVKKRFIEKERKVRKSGVGGSVARGFGKLFRKDDWGYEYVTTSEEVVDKEETKKMLFKLGSTVVSEYGKSIKSWQQRCNQLSKVITDELKRREEDFEEKQKAIVQLDKVKRLIIQLSNVLQNINRNLSSDTNLKESTKVNLSGRHEVAATAAAIDANYIEFPIKEQTIALYRLANIIIDNIFDLVYDTCQRENKLVLKNLDTTIVWGWDSACMESFSQRFLGTALQPAEQEQLKSTGVIHRANTIFVNENSLEKGKLKGEMQKLEEALNSSNCNIYMLVNAIQQGASAKQVAECRIKNFAMKNCCINLVAQSLQEFIVDDSIEQVIESLGFIMDKLSGMKSGFLLLNHANPLFSLVLLDLQTRGHITVSDENEILKMVKFRFGTMITNKEYDNISSIIRAYTKTHKTGV